MPMWYVILASVDGLLDLVREGLMWVRRMQPGETHAAHWRNASSESNKKACEVEWRGSRLMWPTWPNGAS